MRVYAFIIKCEKGFRGLCEIEHGTGRNFIGIELDPKFYVMAHERLNRCSQDYRLTFRTRVL